MIKEELQVLLEAATPRPAPAPAGVVEEEAEGDLDDGPGDDGEDIGNAPIAPAKRDPHGST